MAGEHVWTVEIMLTKEGDRTLAEARLRRSQADLAGWGRSRRSPADRRAPIVGEELAAARALSDLAHQLVLAALDVIEEHEAVSDDASSGPDASPTSGGASPPPDAPGVPRR